MPRGRRRRPEVPVLAGEWRSALRGELREEATHHLHVVHTPRRLASTHPAATDAQTPDRDAAVVEPFRAPMRRTPSTNRICPVP
jgi:hypothetical protein